MERNARLDGVVDAATFGPPNRTSNPLRLRVRASRERSCGPRSFGWSWGRAVPTYASSSRICSPSTPTSCVAQPMQSLHLRRAQRTRGVWTISAGNAGQGVAYAARRAGVPCTVVAIETAPESKLERMRALGARLVLAPYDVCWKALEDRAYPGVEGTFIHPFDDDNFIAGHATMGLEILEDAPDTVAVIAAIGGGGLITGVGSAVRAFRPEIKVWGAEPSTAAPAAASFAAGAPRGF